MVGDKYYYVVFATYFTGFTWRNRHGKWVRYVQIKVNRREKEGWEGGGQEEREKQNEIKKSKQTVRERKRFIVEL